jgi:predicted transcriptional regulator
MPNKRLAELLGITERSVRRAVGALADAGAIDIVQDEQMDKTGGFRRLVPHQAHLLSILESRFVPTPPAPAADPIP